jgi:tRNA (mo5U34)-methyltransferase
LTNGEKVDILTGMNTPDHDVSQFVVDAIPYGEQLAKDKSVLAPPERWYPYGSLSNLSHLDHLLADGHRNLYQLAGGKRIADIGAADGDMAFFLASHGFEVDIIDWGPTNFNGLEGARLLAKHYGLPVDIHEVDLDAQFVLPRAHYGLVLFLGILYHLQNPFFVLSQLSRRADYLLLSTRVAARSPDGQLDLNVAPLAYLVGPDEMNNDPTNYWVFSMRGLTRLTERTGWKILDQMTVGCTDGSSDPTRADRDERAFMLLHSTNVVAG